MKISSTGKELTHILWEQEFNFCCRQLNETIFCLTFPDEPNG